MSSQGGVVLLDRDGTLIEERHYLHDPEGVVLLPGVGEGLHRLQCAGYLLGVVTNQAGIGRGYYDEAAMHAVNDRMCKLLAAYDVRLDGIWFCPHAPDAGCSCRKPAPGMVLAAAQKLGFVPSSAVIVGDKPCDVQLAHAVGARGVLVCTGYGQASAREAHADFVAADFREAVTWILRQQTGEAEVTRC